MSDSPEQIRANIEQTRRELSGDVDALTDKVTPAKILDRQTSRIKDSLGSARDRVMGSASDATQSASDAAAQKTQGNPLAVGLIAFGVGVLAASLIPASTKEKELSSSLKDATKPLVDDLTDLAKDVAENLKEPAQDAANSVRDAATDAAATVKDDAASAAAHVSDEADTRQNDENYR